MKRNEEGQSLVEFAVLVPLLVLLLFGTIEFGISLYEYQQESDAVEHRRAAPRLAAGGRPRTRAPWWPRRYRVQPRTASGARPLASTRRIWRSRSRSTDTSTTGRL